MLDIAIHYVNNYSSIYACPTLLNAIANKNRLCEDRSSIHKVIMEQTMRLHPDFFTTSIKNLMWL